MIGTQEQDQFVSDHRWAVISTLRKNGGASSSVVAYARDGDSLIISTIRTFQKVKMLERDPRVTLCVLSNQEPFNFVTVEGVAAIERDYAAILEPTRRVFESLKAISYPEPPDLAAWIERQGRVILRVTAERVSSVIR